MWSFDIFPLSLLEQAVEQTNDFAGNLDNATAYWVIQGYSALLLQD